ncbi:hypothetical protein ACMFMG_011786 [Clarireedia jacksonii]
MASILIIAFMVILLITILLQKGNSKPVSPVPISVNYHFTRKCNYECGFCFHTAKTSYILSAEEAKRGLSLLKKAGMKKLNFAGGEPMMYPKFVGELAKYCKTELGLESVSIVTNGSLYNFEEDMRAAIEAIAPFRWKCLQVLVVKGENDSDTTLRDTTHFVISDDQFQQFCDKHSIIDGFVAEPNNGMKDSYLILDEYMRFLDKGNNPSASILEVGVEKALQSVYWDEKSFLH